MKTYEYRGFDDTGRSCKGLIEALSIKNAREKLAGDGILTESVSLTGRQLRFPLDVRVMVYREISSLLNAGLPLVRALDLLIQSPDMNNPRTLLAGIRDRVKEGAPLATAFSEASRSVTAFECAIIEAAERSATVELMLERLADYLEEQEKLKERIQSALIYPSIVLTVGICVAVLMLGVLVPRARDILQDSDVPLPVLTQWMMGLGSALMWGLCLVPFFLGFVFYVRHKLNDDVDFRVRWNRRLFSIPLWGRGYTILVNVRFARTLSILLHGGMSLIDALGLAARATGSAWIEQLSKGETEAIRHGSSLSDAVRRMPPLSHSLPGLIQVGEATGELERLLDNGGKRYQDQWERFSSRCLSFLEPLLILAIGGFVLLVTLSVLLPVLSLSKGLS